MKKTLCALLSGVLALSLCACGQLDGNGNPIPDTPVQVVCVVTDATACCAQGLEFVCRDDKTYPDDYPARGADITVTGEFESYQDADGITCYRLVDAVLS